MAKTKAKTKYDELIELSIKVDTNNASEEEIKKVEEFSKILSDTISKADELLAKL